MPNFKPFFAAFSTPVKWSLSLCLSLGLSMSMAEVGWANSPETAPPELQEVISLLQTAANNQDLQTIEQLYSSNFVNSDGLNRSSLMEVLENLWQRYPEISYNTEIQSWERQGEQIIVETITYINGTGSSQGKIVNLEANLRTRQYLENQQVVRQEILTERTELTSGENPPQVRVNLPDTVRPGRQYFFDAIVEEPLGDDPLLGAALEEDVSVANYLDAAEFELELLPAGGIYKIGSAPRQEGNQWISAILIRSDGMTIISQRLKVEE